MPFRRLEGMRRADFSGLMRECPGHEDARSLGSMNRFRDRLAAYGVGIRRGRLEALQINEGRNCNQACTLRHVNAAPWRREMMAGDVARRVGAWIRAHRPPIVDLTGGAPELANSFNPATVPGLMCWSTLSVGMLGEVFDCDFNQRLGLPLRNGRPLFLWDVTPAYLENWEIQTGDPCLACPAGGGSRCTGAVALGPNAAGWGLRGTLLDAPPERIYSATIL